MKKKSLLAVMIVSLTIALVGCGSKGSEELPLEEISSTPSTEQQEILDITVDESRIVESTEETKEDEVDTEVIESETESISEDDTEMNSEEYVSYSLRSLAATQNYLEGTHDEQVTLVRALLENLESFGKVSNIQYDSTNSEFIFTYDNGNTGVYVISE